MNILFLFIELGLYVETDAVYLLIEINKSTNFGYINFCYLVIRFMNLYFEFRGKI